jgi:hypothetical protein
MDSQDTSGYDKPPQNHHLKAIGTVFALLIAPIIAGIAANIGSFFVQKKLEAPAEPPPAPALVPTVREVVVEKPVLVAAPAPATPAVPSPDLGQTANSAMQKALAALHDLPVNHLFNGRDLAGFYTYLGRPQPEAQPIGKDKDPDHIFSVKNGVLAISGQEQGGLTTFNNYGNYLLTVEYRWGLRSYRPRLNLPKAGGIVFHAFGPDGALLGGLVAGFRARLDEAGGGDLSVMSHDSAEPHLSVAVEQHAEVTVKKTERTTFSYKPGGNVREFAPGHHISRLGTINHGARFTPGGGGGTIWEKPTGEWNTIEVLCVGDSVGIILNGTLVNAASKASRTGGKIQLYANKADIFFRTVDLRTIPRGFPLPAGIPKPSMQTAIAKAPEKNKPRTADVPKPTKNKGVGRGTRPTTKK